jgi:hypothetical protein
VTLGPESSLADVAIVTGDALRRAGIKAVLTGGACAHVHSAGSYASRDVDFVITSPCEVATVDRALATVGFERRGSIYRREDVAFYVEFPRGPLGIGDDLHIVPVWKRKRGAKTLALSPTDACRDRLAAFYHWNDRQSLDAAIAIAVRNRIRMAKVREWSCAEGHARLYRTFVKELAIARKARTHGR